jgi:uncharacterized membrane protein YphA (DoxX/SURF4 family)
MAGLAETRRQERDRARIVTPILTLKEALASPWLTVRVQIALGLFFVVAALPKLVDPPSFAHMIYNYRIVPGTFVNVLALVMPWFELLAGLALILGIWTRTSAALVGALLLVFIVAISLNLARTNAIDCGCFDVSAANKTAQERLADMRLVVLRDVGMLFMVAQILWAKGRTAAGAPAA